MAVKALRLRSKHSSGKLPGLSDIKLTGLVEGYGCCEYLYEVNLTQLKVEGFEGIWRCCKLGCGGWGCAYRCVNGESREVVVKVPHGYEYIIEQGGEAPTVSERFMRKLIDKAKALKALRHSNVVALLGYSEVAPLLIYEYAKQGSLEWQLKHGWKPDLREALIVAAHVANGLRYVHSRGLVHGDVKPANLFVSDGVVKLGDFSGAVKLLSMISSSGSSMYTVGWRAPEQVYSDLKERAIKEGLENRVDVYQLGNLILYLLTGTTIDGEDVVRSNFIRNALRNVRHGELRELLSQMLSKEAEARPSADECLTKIRSILTNL